MNKEYEKLRRRILSSSLNEKSKNRMLFQLKEKLLREAARRKEISHSECEKRIKELKSALEISALDS